MEKDTTVRLSKGTVARLRELIKLRGRKESIEQIVLELLEINEIYKGLNK